jgi:hypothetical protein
MKACSRSRTRHCRIAVMPVNGASTRCRPIPRPHAAGPVAQWLEPAAHNGLVAGSSPAGPTNEISIYKIREIGGPIGGPLRTHRRACHLNIIATATTQRPSKKGAAHTQALMIFDTATQVDHPRYRNRFLRPPCSALSSPPAPSRCWSRRSWAASPSRPEPTNISA